MNQFIKITPQNTPKSTTQCISTSKIRSGKNLEVFGKLQEELFIDPQLLKRTSWIPFGMQFLQISFYVVILVKKEPQHI